MAAGSKPGASAGGGGCLLYPKGITLDVYSYIVLAVWVVVFGVALTASIRYLNSI
jgi:hypothetical protein